jgi:hypothetical protein
LKTATITELKRELKTKSTLELLELCLKLSRFKKETKEYLTYLIFESEDEKEYIENVKAFITEEFLEMNTDTYYFMRKTVRKILKSVKKFVRFSKKKETELELLMHFCDEMKKVKPLIKYNQTLFNTYFKQIEMAQKALSNLHPDLQLDYQLQLDALDQL